MILNYIHHSGCWAFGIYHIYNHALAKATDNDDIISNRNNAIMQQVDSKSITYLFRL